MRRPMRGVGGFFADSGGDLDVLIVPSELNLESKVLVEAMPQAGNCRVMERLRDAEVDMKSSG